MGWLRRLVSDPTSGAPDPLTEAPPTSEGPPAEAPSPDAGGPEPDQPGLAPEPAFTRLEGDLGPAAATPDLPAVSLPLPEGEPSLEGGVARSRAGFVARLQGLFRGSFDDASWEDVEEALIAGDVGGALALELVERARRRRDASDPEAAVRAELEALLVPRDGSTWQPRRPSAGTPAVVLVVGVNGTGKTTTIAKLAHRETGRGQRVLLAAADTFRAAAIEQLGAWAARLDVPVVAHQAGADPAAVVYDALDAAVARRVDVVIVDTAGRLHTKHNLMDELAKIRRTIDKRLPGSEPDVLFVLDGTTGQNGLTQARAFHEASPLTGLILTKLDSTAKGGIVFAVEQALGVPVLFVGVGEQLGDLVPFEPHAFVAALFD
ncbi:MAG TPA: signal recognition particle-docking protein FtsY [Candidatus Dormibacteraeota bacterium]|nr:signal recognition particle-docking protein FtsY [Candidatus Dormibacteraeota bacterium]